MIIDPAYIKEGKVIIYDKEVPDMQYGEILWSSYGLIDTNEIAVVVTCGNKSFAAVAPSTVTVPVMADRVWAIDVHDQMLAYKLGDELWERYADELLEEVDRLRERM